MSNGLGHLYMNQMKTFFNTARDIIMEPQAKYVLHFEVQLQYSTFSNAVTLIRYINL